jgi:hypothetical protein
LNKKFRAKMINTYTSPEGRERPMTAGLRSDDPKEQFATFKNRFLQKKDGNRCIRLLF